MKTLFSFLLLAVANLIHSQEHEQMIVFTLQGVLQKLEDISDKLEGYEAIQQKQDEILDKLMELHHELEHVKGATVNNQESLQRLSRETRLCPRGEDLEHLTNLSVTSYQETKSLVHEEISGVISLAEKDIDECIQGLADCSNEATCINIHGSYSCSCNPPFEGDGRTCSCPGGFALSGDICEDIDECTEANDVCSPNAICKNSFGSYSCLCNKPFEGDGKTSCECKSRAIFIRGLGCIELVMEMKTFPEMSNYCQELGGRVVQDFDGHHSSNIAKAYVLSLFGFGWVGVYDGKWTSEESLVPEDLWWEGYRSDPSRRCGILVWDSSFSVKMTQTDCSEKRWGYCQFVLP